MRLAPLNTMPPAMVPIISPDNSPAVMTPRLIPRRWPRISSLPSCAPRDMSSRQLVLAINATCHHHQRFRLLRITTLRARPQPRSVAVHQQDARHVPAFSRYVQPHKGQARTPPHRGFSNQAGTWRSDRQSFPPRTEVH